MQSRYLILALIVCACLCGCNNVYDFGASTHFMTKHLFKYFK